MHDDRRDEAKNEFPNAMQQSVCTTYSNKYATIELSLGEKGLLMFRGSFYCSGGLSKLSESQNVTVFISTFLAIKKYSKNLVRPSDSNL